MAAGGAIVAVTIVLLWVASGSGFGPFASLGHHSPPPSTAPTLTVAAVYFLISGAHGSPGILGPSNQSVCGQCPAKYRAANPCNVTISLSVLVSVANQDSVPHTLNSLSVSVSVGASNQSWSGSFWSNSGQRLPGFPYTVLPGAAFPYEVLNLTLLGPCTILTGSVFLIAGLGWS